MNKFNLLLLAAALAPLPAHATVNYSWSFTSSSCDNGSCSGVGSNSYGNAQTFDSTAKTDISEVTVKAFSTTSDIDTSETKERFETANLKLYSGGLGATGREDYGTTPDHAFDNGGGSTDSWEAPGGDVDAALFAFNQSTTLNSISIGWDNGAADISVMAYTGANGSMATPGDVTNKSFLDLLNSGWVFIGNYLNLDSPSNPTVAINAGNVSSSYWLVSAYTSCASGTCNASDSYYGNDYFKISGLGACVDDATSKCSGGGNGGNNGVPEPSSVLLLAGGFLGWRLNRYAKTELKAEDCLAA
ncbi:MAG: PEP-CTERM sorting domain-containing protein [Methylomonas sp.]|nr:PEP-CTERM sorting domain-containing protein [Methylomonas sp.]